MPQTYEDVVDLLIPELQRRGIFWNDYCVPGGTYRENILEKPGQREPLPSHPAAKLIWRPPPKSQSVKAPAKPARRVHYEEGVETKGDFSDWW